MKRKLLVVGLFGIVLLAVGAVIFETSKASRTVDSWSSLVSEYKDARTQMPPLPMHTADVLSRMDNNDFSFLADRWQVHQPGGIWFAEEDSALSQLDLPLKVMILEDIRLNEIIVMAGPVAGDSLQGVARRTFSILLLLNRKRMLR